ncbi:replication initiation protein [Heliorestis acidaminivorans]|uniref:Replication initiation protein n=1 Tax=Heliorestis acidaminivorans TaxID=553427 RepID=A0A6I0EVP8_9FIRM|nr:replication initiation protein [Heliorestis acidaminivorans]KAB2950897.1 replication initiation protein [Heliorestis acidaminivorans]
MNGENWIVKSNALIECRTRMTALEQKIMVVLASEISPNDEDFKDYEFSIKEFAELTGTNEKSAYAQIHESAKKLMQKVITYRKNGRTRTVALLSFAETIEGEGKVIMRFDKALKSELLGLKELFTQYKTKNVLGIKGSHAIRLYELLKQYEKIKKREFEVDELKELLGVGDGYNRFDNFERRILAPAKTEINEKTDIWIDCKKIKRGRKIARLKFEIEPKHFEEDEELYETEEIKLIRNKAGLQDEKFSGKQIMQLYEIAVEKTDRFNLDPYRYIELNYIYSLKKAEKNLYAFLKGALEKDYAKAKITMIEEM